jgi:hypothetical protein
MPASNTPTRRRDWRIPRKFSEQESIGDVLAEYPQATSMQRLINMANEGETPAYRLRMAANFVEIMDGTKEW